MHSMIRLQSYHLLKLAGNWEDTWMPALTCLSSRAFCHVQRLSELGKAVVDGSLLQASPISCQALVKGDGISLGVLPVGDAGGDLPVLLVLHTDGARGGVHDGDRGGACSPWYLQVMGPTIVSQMV